MSDDSTDKSSKTHPPSDKRKSDLKKKGDLPTPRELGSAFLVLGLIVLAVLVLPLVVPIIATSLTSFIANAGTVDVGSGLHGISDIGNILTSSSQMAFWGISGLFTVFVAASFLVPLAQGHLVFAVERIKPKATKISPKSGLKRLFSVNTVADFLKNLIKVFFVGGIAVWVCLGAVKVSSASNGVLIEIFPRFLLNQVMLMLFYVASFIFPLATIDWFWQRHQWMKNNMMSTKEIRDEHKESEGDPTIKGKRAAIRRERASVRLIHILPKASVVITNPTHFAVALKYDPKTDIAPVCIAKGRDLIALRIRELCHDTHVPVIENKLVARMLYASTEVDDTIPVEHWKAVAGIVGFVQKIQENSETQPPFGSRLIKPLV